MQTDQLQYRIGQMLSVLEERLAARSVPVDPIEWSPRGENDWRPFENGGEWGASGEWFDFRFACRVPESFRGRVILRLRTGREDEWAACNPQFLCTVNGRVEQAFDGRHPTLVLAEKAEPGRVYSVLLAAYTPEAKPGQTPPRLLATLEDEDADLLGLLYDLRAPWEAACLLPEGDRDRERTFEALSDSLDLLDLRVPDSPAFHESVAAAREYLQREFYEKRAALPPVAVADSMGHTHIDVAWLWDLEQTRHKAARSFATVLKLMERYPEYKFMSSQPVLYSFVKEDHPDLYERIRRRVAEGRWEPEGGMWLEADCNLTGGESLVRQFLHGQEFFRREFGKASRVLWLPDVFGYSAALPQICKLCGIDFFMTSKLSWSEVNLFPYDTFLWKGLDGTEMLTHFTPTRDLVSNRHQELQHFTTYNAVVKPSQYAGAWKRFQQKDLDDHFLVTYGHGDGGGGPTEGMLEMSRRMATPLPGTPVFRQSHAREFFENLEKRVSGDPRLPKWSGELYLEHHRGTYTAMAKNKRNNRKLELGLRDVELLSSMAYIEKGLPYPQEELHALWQDALTLQFHDILPGSSIEKVYQDSDRMYARVFSVLEALRARALAALSESAPGDIVFYNTLGFERDDVVWFEAPADVTALRDEAGEIYPVQRVPSLDGGTEKCCAFVCGLTPMGATPFWFERGDMGRFEIVDADETGFDTPFFAGSFDESMRVASLIEKQSGRELVLRGEALNRLVVYENRPHEHDAWEMKPYYARRHWELDELERCEIVSAGPVCAVLRCSYRYSRSRVVQDIILYHDLERVDFDTWADWHEDHCLLKAHFPVDVFQSEATYDVQFGNVRRSTTRNTSWDQARFEVCAHKWADVSEDNFGFALLNDCKYGHSADESGLQLTLLKSSTHPNPHADEGDHRFLYSAMPHFGSWREAGVAEMAYRLNVPVLWARSAGGDQPPQAFAVSDRPNVVIEAVKQELSGDGIVLRVYENWGRRELGARVRLGYEPAQAEIANLLEEPIAEAELDDGALVFDLRPYEIKTFLLR